MYRTIFDIKHANRIWAHKNEREYWFGPGPMGFFSSRLHEKVYSGRYFITSEQYEATDYAKSQGSTDGPRRWSIRICKPSGEIDTVGVHMGFESLQQAETAVEELERLTDKYLHTPAIPGYGNQLMVLKCSDPEVIKTLDSLSIDKGTRKTFYLVLSGAEVGVWEFNDDKFPPAQFFLVARFEMEKVSSPQGIELTSIKPSEVY